MAYQKVKKQNKKKPGPKPKDPSERGKCKNYYFPPDVWQYFEDQERPASVIVAAVRSSCEFKRWGNNLEINGR